MAAEEKPKYACPHCGCAEYITMPDAYSLFQATGDKLHFARALLIDDYRPLYCRSCSELAPRTFQAAAGR